jgi:hypothetical protein
LIRNPLETSSVSFVDNLNPIDVSPGYKSFIRKSEFFHLFHKNISISATFL